MLVTVVPGRLVVTVRVKLNVSLFERKVSNARSTQFATHYTQVQLKIYTAAGVVLD